MASHPLGGLVASRQMCLVCTGLPEPIPMCAYVTYCFVWPRCSSIGCDTRGGRAHFAPALEDLHLASAVLSPSQCGGARAVAPQPRSPPKLGSSVAKLRAATCWRARMRSTTVTLQCQQQIRLSPAAELGTGLRPLKCSATRVAVAVGTEYDKEVQAAGRGRGAGEERGPQ